MPKRPPLDPEAVFCALSDGTRLRVLNLLRLGELCVCDLVGLLDAPQPTVAEHLKYLRGAGLVVGRKRGLWTYYRLAPVRSVFHRKVLDCLVFCPQVLVQLERDAARLVREGRTGCSERGESPSDSC